MASSNRSGGMDTSSSPSRCRIGLVLPWMCAGLVVGIEVWQNGMVFGLLVSTGGALLLGLLFFGLRLYSDAGSLPGPSVTRESLFDLLGLEKHELDFEPSLPTWRDVNGTAVLRF